MPQSNSFIAKYDKYLYCSLRFLKIFNAKIVKNSVVVKNYQAFFSSNIRMCFLFKKKVSRI